MLRYKLTSMSLSLANQDGTINKTMKSELFNSFENLISLISCNALHNTSKIFDDMVLLQMLPPTLKKFGDISDYRLHKIIDGRCRVTSFVTARFIPTSVGQWKENDGQ